MSAAPRWLKIDDYLQRFEAAWEEHGAADLADFLPEKDGPLYLAILREAACVDLELSARQGHLARLDELLQRFPELRADEVTLEALAFQEYRLQIEAGHAVKPGDYRNRYGIDVTRWPTQVRQVRDHAAVELGDWRDYAASRFAEHLNGPATGYFGSVDHADWARQRGSAISEEVEALRVGTAWFGFRLVRELGRGAFGRVFLAEQTGLANRQVALKVGADLISETHALAQLQHTNIVPIYSAHRAGPLQAVCMPYFGPTTLVDVLRAVHRTAGRPSTGPNALWSTIHDHLSTTTVEGPVEPPAPGQVRPEPPPLATLHRLDHPSAVLWLAARLADGLAHAHERGILHRDIKPANVLLADDGQPMLLDFNLSADVRLRSGVPAILGGTLPYMAPEHLEAFLGGTRPVDARSDLYALGLILYELLAGRPPFPPPAPGPLNEQVPRMIAQRRAGPPPLRGRGISPAVESIVRHCLAPEPEARYAYARQLQEDAELQLNHLPLRYAPDRSLLERAQKQLRRRPRLWLGLAAGVLIVLLATATWSVRQQRLEARRAQATATVAQFREELHEARGLLALPQPTREERSEGERVARQALGRFGLPDNVNWLQAPPFIDLPATARDAVRVDCGELLLLLARAVRQADGSRRAEALALNDRAAECGGHLRARLFQRALLVAEQGNWEEANDLLRQANEAPILGGLGHRLEGSRLLGEGRLTEAVDQFRLASRLDPGSAAAWAAVGEGERLVGRLDRAAAAFTAYLALRREDWRGHARRAQVRLDLGDADGAAADAEEVIRLAPARGVGPFLLAMAHLRQGNLASADRGLADAIRLDPSHTRLYFARAEVLLRRNDPAGAARLREEGARREPTDELSCIARGLDRLQRADAPGARDDFERALKLNPWSHDALQNLAHVLSEHLRRPKEAIATLDRLLRVRRTDAKALAGRAVLHARAGDRAAAIADAAQALHHEATGLILYQAGCVYALLSANRPADQIESIRLLRAALKAGFGAEHLASDPDLASLRGSERHDELLKAARALRP